MASAVYGDKPVCVDELCVAYDSPSPTHWIDPIRVRRCHVDRMRSLWDWYMPITGYGKSFQMIDLLCTAEDTVIGSWRSESVKLSCHNFFTS